MITKQENIYNNNNLIIQKNGISSLHFLNKFRKQGKQGIVGLLDIDGNGNKCVFKISQTLNYLPVLMLIHCLVIVRSTLGFAISAMKSLFNVS